MNNYHKTLPSGKSIALVAHDNRKIDIIRWAIENQALLAPHKIYATKSTGTMVQQETDLQVKTFLSGPLGGDQQLGHKIVEGHIHALFFFWDTLSAQPHDPDVKALLRIATLWNIAIACNETTADFILRSPLFASSYEKKIPAHLTEMMH